MASEHIIDVSDDSFDAEVVGYSNQVPVIIDFWAPWSVSSRVQSPLLVNLAHEGQGQFRLARINVEEQPKLAERLKVTSVPSVKAFVNGRIVAEFAGVLPEEKMRALISRILPDQGDLLLAKGLGLMELGEYKEARQTLAEFLFSNQDNAPALLAFIRASLFLSEVREAAAVLLHFPASREYTTAEEIKPLVRALRWAEQQPMFQDDPLAAAYVNALRLVKKGKLLAGLDGLLDLLRKDRNYRDQEARQVYLGILHVLGENHPEIGQYRADLSRLLF